jgi:hypothetical protein
MVTGYPLFFFLAIKDVCENSINLTMFPASFLPIGFLQSNHLSKGICSSRTKASIVVVNCYD